MDTPPRRSASSGPAAGQPAPLDRRAAEEISRVPADALGGVWELLDALPRSVAPPSLTSTTLEMAAVTAGGRPLARVSRAPIVARIALWKWGVAAACVAGAFVGGVVASRSTLLDPDQRILENLPLMRHFDVLREAGSIGFLEGVARGNYPPPRRFPFGRPGEPGRPEGRGENRPGERPAPGERAGERGSERAGPGERRPPPEEAVRYRELDACIAELPSAPFGAVAGEILAARRLEVGDLSAAARRSLADSAQAFRDLTPSQRHDIEEVARLFAGGQAADLRRQELLDAARLWHQWVESRDPADRQAVIQLNAADRLEWLDRYARINARPPRDWPRGPNGPPGRPGGPADRPQLDRPQLERQPGDPPPGPQRPLDRQPPRGENPPPPR
jgi:hypothetical protein